MMFRYNPRCLLMMKNFFFAWVNNLIACHIFNIPILWFAIQFFISVFKL